MIVIIGAGISGLSLAWHLQKQNKPYLLLEASDKAGGNIQTSVTESYILEKGPNSILCDSSTLGFIDSLGISDQLLPAEAVNKNRFIFSTIIIC